MADVDLAVLAAVEIDVMNPKVVSRALRLALDAIKPSADEQIARQQALVAEQEKLQRELDRLANAIAGGSSSSTSSPESSKLNAG